MSKIRQGKGDTPGISQDKNGRYRVTKPPKERERNKKDPLKIDKKIFKIRDPFKT